MKLIRRLLSAFTLVELMIVLAIIAVLAGIFAGVALRVRYNSRATVCLHNLRQISTALMMYNQEYRMIPTAENPPLRTVLAPYLMDEKVFICPSTPVATDDSYSRYYIPREPSESSGFLIGCANHANDNTAMGSYGAGRGIKEKLAPVTWNGKVVGVGSEVTGGTLHFADGTDVTINGSLRVMVVTSFTEGDSRIYSAIRIPEGAIGSIEVHAAHGTRFDVATPACTAGVRGTRFTVTTEETPEKFLTTIAVSEGVVAGQGFYPSVYSQDISADETKVFERPRTASYKLAGPYIVAWDAISYQVTNISSTPLVIKSIRIQWPAISNKRLDWIKINGLLAYNTKSYLTDISIANWIASDTARTVAPGQTAVLEFDFEKAANTDAGSYNLELEMLAEGDGN